MQSALAWYCGTSTTSASASLSSALLGDGGCCTEFTLTEEALRRHYSLVYVLLDEMSACGYPATVQGNVLQMLVPRPSVMEAAMKLVRECRVYIHICIPGILPRYAVLSLVDAHHHVSVHGSLAFLLFSPPPLSRKALSSCGYEIHIPTPI